MAYKPELWAEAKKKCRLNEEDVRMAKEMRLNPKSLIKNIPSPREQWKQPVKIWIRELYEERHRKMEQLRLSLTLMGVGGGVCCDCLSYCVFFDVN